MQTPATFTAAHFARALGVSRVRARQLLGGSEPSGRVVVSGNDTSTWRICDLHPRVLGRLAERASDLKFDSAIQLLKGATEPWQPDIPLGRVCAVQVAEARRLRDAMLPFVEKSLHDAGAISALVADGLQAFSRAFGYSVSERHWRRLLARCAFRAGADCDASRLEIYLPSKLRETAPTITASENAELPTLSAEIEHIAGKPMGVDAREALWSAALVDLDSTRAAGATPKQAKRLVAEYLWTHCPQISRSREALDRVFRDKVAAWEQNGRSVVAVLDRRRSNGGLNRWEELPEQTKDLLNARSQNRGQRISQAWRELWLEGKLHEEAYERCTFDWLAKSKMPSAMRKQITPGVRALKPFHQGKRAANSAKAAIRQDYVNMPSGARWSYDDSTANHLTYLKNKDGSLVRGPNGKTLLFRPQILAGHDDASNYIPGAIVLPKPTYNQIDIARLLRYLHELNGYLPEHHQMEHGMWETGRLVVGRTSIGWEERVDGLKQQLGLVISRARSPGAKPIELAWKNLQARTDHWPGYVGRESRYDMPEVTKRAISEVESGKAHPAQWFMEFDEYCAKFLAMIDAYNSEPQRGKLDGLSPREAYVRKFTNGRLIKFHEPVRHLMESRHFLTVTKNGLTILDKYRYFGAELAPRLGEKVIAWFDEMDPTLIAVTDRDCRNAVAVPLVVNPPANQPGSAEMKRALAAQSAQFAWARTYYAKLRQDFPEEFAGRTKRPALVDGNTVLVGEEIAAARAQKKEEQKAEIKSTRRVKTAAAKLDYTAPPVPSEEADEQARSLEFLARRGIKSINPAQAHDFHR